TTLFRSPRASPDTPTAPLPVLLESSESASSWFLLVQAPAGTRAFLDEPTHATHGRRTLSRGHSEVDLTCSLTHPGYGRVCIYVDGYACIRRRFQARVN